MLHLKRESNIVKFHIRYRVQEPDAAHMSKTLIRDDSRGHRISKFILDTGAMERAMGYAGECAERAEEYKAEAEEGMEEDAREAREKAREEFEKAIQKRREERKAGEARVTGEERKAGETRQTGEEWNAGETRVTGDGEKPEERNGGNSPEGKREPVTYTRTGTVVPVGQDASISISI